VTTWLDVAKVCDPIGEEAWESELRHRIRLLAERIRVPDVAFSPISEPARVLVVEDDAPTREVVAEALSDEGFTVTAARDGADALELASARHPDVIVLDIGLPTLDGPSFAARWRERGAAAEVPIVVMSGRPDGPEAATAMAAAAFYRKPLDLLALSATIRALAYGPRTDPMGTPQAA
jgi:two-component system cell cycle sensor histidine kinase/response regulator CckA